MAPLRMKRFYDTTFHIDDQEVPVQIRRFNKETWEEFQQGFKRISDPPSNRLVLVRRQSGDEQERDEKTNAFIVSDAVVMARRLAEMSAEQRAAYDRQDAEDDAVAATFLRESVVKYVVFPENTLEVETDSGDVVPIHTGADLVEHFPSRGDLLQRLVQIITEENTMSPLEKKARRSLSALKAFSAARVLEVDGATPAAIADAAASVASVPSGTATEVSATTPSGSETFGANP